jgi:hypothetical protein
MIGHVVLSTVLFGGAYYPLDIVDICRKFGVIAVILPNMNDIGLTTSEKLHLQSEAGRTDNQKKLYATILSYAGE